MGKSVAATVGARLGRPLLELGGNNAAIVAPSADLALAVRGIVFSAVGTCGQRCTSLRRLIVHESIADELVQKLIAAYGQLSIGNPLEPATLIGPLIDEDAAEKMRSALDAARAEEHRRDEQPRAQVHLRPRGAAAALAAARQEGVGRQGRRQRQPRLGRQALLRVHWLPPTAARA